MRLTKRFRIGKIYHIPVYATGFWVIFIGLFGMIAAATNFIETYAALVEGLFPYAPPMPTLPHQTENLFQSVGLSIWYGLGVSFGVALTMILHEFGHVYAAQEDRFAIRDVTFHWAGGWTRQDISSRKGLIKMRAGGPAANLLLGLMAAVGFILFTKTTLSAPAISVIFHLICVVNISVGIVNFIPINPLDGSLIFRAAKATTIEPGGLDEPKISTLPSYKLLPVVMVFTCTELAIGLKGILFTLLPFLYEDTIQWSHPTNPPTLPAGDTDFAGKRVAIIAPLSEFSTDVEAILSQRGAIIETELSTNVDYIIYPGKESRYYYNEGAWYQAYMISVSAFDKMVREDRIVS
jgi:Zn-dependent protease